MVFFFHFIDIAKYRENIYCAVFIDLRKARQNLAQKLPSLLALERELFVLCKSSVKGTLVVCLFNTECR